MQIVAWVNEGGDIAIVERPQGGSEQNAVRREQVNMMLIGPQPLGTWILSSLGLAQEVIDDAERALIEDALAALSASLEGDYDPSQHFGDLQAGRPELQ
jgi:hydrogenase expression/formation protein HypC